jgi:DNA-binding CsgD family transcriptional regulator
MVARVNSERRRQRAVELTPAEARVLPLLATHLTLSGIADRLGVCRSTVKTHVASIYRKFGSRTRAQALERAEADGFLELPAVARRGRSVSAQPAPRRGIRPRR